MHPFYRLPLAVQWAIALPLALSTLLPFILALHNPWILLGSPLWVSWGFFASTPLLRLVGVYRYYSRYLCVMFPTQRRLDIHLGTTFDHVPGLRLRNRGRVARSQLLVGALDGLIAIADQVDAGQLSPDVTVEGTSWFFTASTVERLGFELAPPTWLGRAIPWLIALDIALMYSFTQGRIALPPTRGVRRARTTGATLLAHRPRLVALRDRLQRSAERAA